MSIEILEGNEFLISEYVDEFLEKTFKKSDELQKKFSIIRNPDNFSVMMNRSPLAADRRVIIWAWDVLKKFEEFNPFVIPKDLSIFVISYVKIDKRSVIYKSLVESYNATHKIKEFKDLYPNQIEAWVSARTRKIKLALPPDCIKLLAVYYGVNLQELSNQLMALKDLNQPITRELIGKTCTATNPFSIFILQDTLLMKDASKTIYIFRQLVKDGSQGFEILRYFTSYFEKLMIVKLNDEGLIANLKLHAYVQKKMEETRVTLGYCKFALNQIRFSEKKIFKGFPTNYVVERLLFNLCKN